MTSAHFDSCVSIMNEIAKAIENGHTIDWIPYQKELRWVWLDRQSLQEWSIKLSTVKRIIGVDVLHRTIVIDFVTNKKDALTAKKWLSKIDNLKVYL